MKSSFALAVVFAVSIALAENPFIFTITADSHLDDHTDLEFYQRTLRSAAAEKPLFHVDLGDTFMSEKTRTALMPRNNTWTSSATSRCSARRCIWSSAITTAKAGVALMARRPTSPSGRAPCG